MKPVTPKLFVAGSGGAGFGLLVGGYRNNVTGYGKRALLQVEPARLVELAASSQSVLRAMSADWEDAQDDLRAACVGLGDASGTSDFQVAYTDSLADAGQVVAALLHALDVGVTGLVESARDAVDVDETVAAEIVRTTVSIHHEDSGPPPRADGGH